MIITRVKLTGYRNYESLDFAPSERLSILVGDNAQGKTNLLEAIFLCAVGRSQRAAKDAELINNQSPGAYVRCELQNGKVDHCIEIRLGKQGKKQIKLDGSAITRIGELMGCLNAVFFSPDDLALVKEGPSQRRRYMDLALCQTDKSYFYSLSSYQKALEQRNALLKDVAMGKSNPSLLNAYNGLLAQYGGQIAVKRAAFMRDVSAIASQKHAALSDSAEKLELKYESCANCESESTAIQSLLDLLEANQAEDIRRASTQKGLHREDIKLILNGSDLRSFGSQGQQRCTSLALKLAELDYLHQATGNRPVLLLDDVLSELDLKRQACLLQSIGECQTLITCTHLEQTLLEKTFTTELSSDLPQNNIQAEIFHVPF